MLGTLVDFGLFRCFDDFDENFFDLKDDWFDEGRSNSKGFCADFFEDFSLNNLPLALYAFPDFGLRGLKGLFQEYFAGALEGLLVGDRVGVEGAWLDVGAVLGAGVELLIRPSVVGMGVGLKLGERVGLMKNGDEERM